VTVIIAVVNLTPVPVATHDVLLVVTLFPLGYGVLSRRWWRAIVSAAVLMLLAAAGLGGLLPDGIDATYRGPAESLAPRAAWSAVTVVLALDLALAARIRRHIPVTPIGISDDQTPLVRSRLEALTARVAAVEEATRP
jgi:hypothetical protein